MNRTPRRVTILAIAAALAVVAALPAASVTSTVTLADVSGSRVLTVTDATGTDLDAATISTGAGADIPFVTNVSDLLYDNVGYTVDASLSNLYLTTGIGVYDCDVYVPSSELSIAWPTEAFGIDGVEALVSDVLFDVSTAAVSSGNALLDTIILDASLLGALDGTSDFSAADLTRSGQGLIQSTLDAVTLESALIGEVLDDLPIQVTVPNTGVATPFADPVAHSTAGCADTAGETSVNLQTGSPNGGLDLVELATAIQSDIGTGAALVSGGYLTESEVLSGLFPDPQLTEIQTAVAASLPAVQTAWDAYVDTLIAALSLDGVSVSSVVGQTGTYTSLPSLVVDSALDVAGTGTAPTGVVNSYEGELLITLTSS